MTSRSTRSRLLQMGHQGLHQMMMLQTSIPETRLILSGSHSSLSLLPKREHCSSLMRSYDYLSSSHFPIFEHFCVPDVDFPEADSAVSNTSSIISHYRSSLIFTDSHTLSRDSLLAMLSSRVKGIKSRQECRRHSPNSLVIRLPAALRHLQQTAFLS